MIQAVELATPRSGAGVATPHGAPAGPHGGGHPAMDTPPQQPDEFVARATSAAAARAARHARLWAMTREERIAAFHRNGLTFEDCMAWSRRYPDEPPTGPCGEYLYILATTPEWLGES